MKILMLVNWNIKYTAKELKNEQPMNYVAKNQPYWFFRYFNKVPKVDVIDTHSLQPLEKFEKNVIRFYIIQALKVIPKLNSYDLVVSHGMQSGIVLALFRRFFCTRPKHIVFDIGTFNSAAEKGVALKLMQFSSKSIDQLIYHTTWQKTYYDRMYPWIVKKSIFIPLGIEQDILQKSSKKEAEETQYFLCIGRDRCDWVTVINAYKKLNTKFKLRFIGAVEKKIFYNDKIEVLPRIPFNELIAQIQNAFLCILPIENVKYSFGQIRLLQQMAMKKCVIVPRAISLLDYGIDESTVLFYEPGNADSCANAIRKIINSPNLKSKIELAAEKVVNEKFTEEKMAKEIERCFNKLLAKQVKK